MQPFFTIDFNKPDPVGPRFNAGSREYRHTEARHDESRSLLWVVLARN
jgi:hypothetical protein